MNFNSTSANSYQAFPLIGRVLLAAIFLVSGFSKLMAPGPTIGYIASLGLPVPLLGYIGSMTLELAASVLLIVGYRTRLIAALLAVYSIVTALIFHHALGDQNQMFHFLKNLAMSGGLLQVVAFGAGAYSFDNRGKGTAARIAAAQ
ncbi:DoxX family protein [bacterium M00.F.Ca.ET.228.01.1.1]|uniref:DoxX family protein n=1 Tax=Paraburkholderia phenoliruptrix TaxID=252970 RepID=UPI001092EA20|nr:DoxX family protein [Paraburkholderia phenoliruptrix]TGP41481.1 DoxX family protein [bacterium M00.F.Ca.ET.228.01.1.1]TGR98138.1 DoxX family protein [bacterium M00.F.Ca.ET.191.01.1.1]TGU02329.1 DoxX family protein [bacterium M00.F.Ca.ET.155.01.1.1]MBW0447127.1 DoxX family protein [Paraburkholderia phenoliruptrix]MBW9101490.1 DoxX family protein [Paraburkholderia phenoliruptrix]